MAEILEFPTKKESDDNKDQKYQEYYKLVDELGILESRLEKMCEKIDTSYDQIYDQASDLIIELQVELAGMRERKFYSPIKRKKILEEIKEIRKIWRESGPLFEEWEIKSSQVYHLGKELKIPEDE